ncbi:MAG: hypothetical protein ACOWWR_12340 [Eubacteriales bacterium]
MDKTDLYNERLERMLITSDHKEPDRVPVFTIIADWSISYYGTTYRACIDNPEWYVTDVSTKIYEDLNCDIAMSAGLLNNDKIWQMLGDGPRFISQDGISVQHKEGLMMEPEDYDKLISDPWDFFITDFLPRRYPTISIEKVAETVKYLLDESKRVHWIGEYFKENLGIPVLAASDGGYASPPFDFLFDSLRGFKGTIKDIRRIPDKFFAAIEVLYPILEPGLALPESGEKVAPFPLDMTMLHAPTFLSQAQFNKFFAPSYDKMLKKVYNSGRKFFMLLEGNWEQHYDWLASMPKNFLIAMAEKDNVFEMKKRLGDTITIVGGMPVRMLKYESKQKCLDYAKRLIDELAPGGGYMFGTDMVLESPGDVNPDNYISVFNFAYEYGKY